LLTDSPPSSGIDMSITMIKALDSVTIEQIFLKSRLAIAGNK